MATTAQHQEPKQIGSEQPALSVVLPAYNEVDNLTPLVSEIIDALEDQSYGPYEIVIADDGSTDGTREAVWRLSQLFDQVRAVTLARNYGQSTALRAGIDEATGEVIVPMDADGQNDPADISRLVGKLEDDNLDCVSGWRRNRHDPWHKRWPSQIQTRLAKRTGPDINDFGCTIKAYRAEAIGDIDLYGEGHRYIPAKLYKRGYSVGEVEVNHRHRENGHSRYGVGRLMRGFVDLLFYWFWVRFSTRPIHLLGGAGLAFMSVGGAIGAVSVVQKYAFGVQLAPRTPRLILVALLVVFGLQLLVFGFLAEMLTRLHYREEQPYRVERVVG